MPDPHKFVTVIPPVNDTIQPEAYTCCEWCGFYVCFGTMSSDRISELQLKAAKGCPCSNLGSPKSDSPVGTEPAAVRDTHLVVRMVQYKIEERYLTDDSLKARKRFDDFCKISGASDQDLAEINMGMDEKQPYWVRPTKRDGKPHQAVQWCRIQTPLPKYDAITKAPTDEYTGR